MDAETGYLVPFRCRTWDCPEDGPRHGRQVTEELMAASLEVGLRYHWTLTLPGEGSPLRGDPNASRGAVARQWNALRAFLRRRGVTFEYAVVPEWQKDGTAHLEVALDRWVDFKDMEEGWTLQGGGFVWVTEYKGIEGAEEVAGYLAKYLSKAVDHPPPWTEVVCTDNGRYRVRPWRRYWTSQGVGKAMRGARERREAEVPSQDGREWVLVDIHLEAVPPARGHGLPACGGHCLQTFERGDCHHPPTEVVELGGWPYVIYCDCTPWRRDGVEVVYQVYGGPKGSDADDPVIEVSWADRPWPRPLPLPGLLDGAERSEAQSEREARSDWARAPQVGRVSRPRSGPGGMPRTGIGSLSRLVGSGTSILRGPGRPLEGCNPRDGGV